MVGRRTIGTWKSPTASGCLHFFFVCGCVCVCVEQEKTVFVDLSRPVLSVPRSPEQRGSIVSLSCVLRALFVVDRVYTDIHSLYSNLSR